MTGIATKEKMNLSGMIEICLESHSTLPAQSFEFSLIKRFRDAFKQLMVTGEYLFRNLIGETSKVETRSWMSDNSSLSVESRMKTLPIA